VDMTAVTRITDTSNAAIMENWPLFALDFLEILGSSLLAELKGDKS